MNKASSVALALVFAAITMGAGYWLGTHRAPAPLAGNPATAASGTLAAAGKKPPKLLYYRNPMGLPDTSPEPKKDPMGMDYIAVFEGEDDAEPAAPNQLKISTDKVQKLGVRTEAAQQRTLDKAIRAAGQIVLDERRQFAIAPKFEGYVDRLHVNVTGQPVSAGQPLFEAYSPELVSAQREYAIAMQGVATLKDAGSDAQKGMKQLAESSLQRLRNWDISDEQLKALAHSGEAKRTLTFRSPVSGIVTEKKAVQGMRFMPGDTLYQIADLSSVWVIADVFEQDIGQIRLGTPAQITLPAYPGKTFEGSVTYIYPTLKAETRTVPVRLELPNPGLLLKPAMFTQVSLVAQSKGAVVSVPVSAVIDSGTRQIVLVEHGAGRFEPREVKLGARSDRYVEVVEGVKVGEPVVVAANFLIDAESNLKAAIGGFGQAGQSTPAQPQPETPAAKTVGHHAEGHVDEIDLKAGTVTISHGPVASLKWPAMTMEFVPANPALQAALKPGAKVAFEFVERKPGEWVITAVTPIMAGAAKADAHRHAGH